MLPLTGTELTGEEPSVETPPEIGRAGFKKRGVYRWDEDNFLRRRKASFQSDRLGRNLVELIKFLFQI